MGRIQQTHHLQLRFNYRGSILNVSATPSVDRGDVQKLSIASALKYGSHALIRNNKEFVRQLLSQSSMEYSPEDNRSKYEENWASDDLSNENLGSRIGVVGREIVVLPGRTHYSYVVSLVSRQLDGDPEKPATVLEIGAGSGRILLALANKLPKIEFCGLEPTKSGCRAIRERAADLGLRNVRVIESPAEHLDSSMVRPDFIYSNLALEQIGSRTLVRNALQMMAMVASPGARFMLREPWPEVNNYHQRAYLRSSAYLSLEASTMNAFVRMPISIEKDLVHHNLRFRIGLLTGRFN